MGREARARPPLAAHLGWGRRRRHRLAALSRLPSIRFWYHDVNEQRFFGQHLVGEGRIAYRCSDDAPGECHGALAA